MEDTQSVRSFWGTEACGTHFVEASKDEKEFFERYRAFRYTTEWHIPALVPFVRFRGKSVLEIGCGNGADGVMFAQHGANYIGVDLTDTAVDATRRHFACLHLNGTFRVENAEALSFGDGSFDAVYSYGVLHHTPHPSRAIREVYRVLKPGGQAIVMLYHRHSFNYHVRIMTYMRLRALIFIVRRWRHWTADRQSLPGVASGVRGNADTRTWNLHYQIFLREGWSYLKARNFVHHCTDGPECPFAFVFSKSEARRLFVDFKAVEFRLAHFPLRKYRWGRCVPLILERLLAARLGWYLFIYATK